MIHIFLVALQLGTGNEALASFRNTPASENPAVSPWTSSSRLRCYMINLALCIFHMTLSPGSKNQKEHEDRFLIWRSGDPLSCRRTKHQIIAVTLKGSTFNTPRWTSDRNSTVNKYLETQVSTYAEDPVHRVLVKGGEGALMWASGGERDTTRVIRSLPNVLAFVIKL